MAKRKKPSPPEPEPDPRHLKDSISRDDFYRGKHVAHEEWFVNDLDLVTWARLRVFNDGTADVWEQGSTISGFVDESHARFYIGEGHYVDLPFLEQQGDSPRSPTPTEQADAAGQSFRYYGVWY
jgi:hypothetical protein